MSRKTKTVTVTLTAAQAEALRVMANHGLGELPDYEDPKLGAEDRRNARLACRALERLVLAMGYRPQQIAGRVGFATIDGRGSLS